VCLYLPLPLTLRSPTKLSAKPIPRPALRCILPGQLHQISPAAKDRPPHLFRYSAHSLRAACQLSSSYVGSYSAQQALLDHRGQQEFVKITVEIYLTNSYGALIPNPDGSRSASSPPPLIPRHYDFWKDFRVQVSDGRLVLSPSDIGGRPLYRCGRYGPCRPRGAAIDLEFPVARSSPTLSPSKLFPPKATPSLSSSISPASPR